MWCLHGSCDLVQVKGMNAVFNLKMEVTVGENLLTGVSVKHHTHCITVLCNEMLIDWYSCVPGGLTPARTITSGCIGKHRVCYSDMWWFLWLQDPTRPLPDVQTRLNKMLEDNKLRYDLDSPIVSVTCYYSDFAMISSHMYISLCVNNLFISITAC